MKDEPMPLRLFLGGLLADEAAQHVERKRGNVSFRMVKLEPSPDGDIITITGGEIWNQNSKGCSILIPNGDRYALPSNLRARFLDPEDQISIDLCFNLERQTLQYVVGESRNPFPCLMRC